jgi:hypothetical protein
MNIDIGGPIATGPGQYISEVEGQNTQLVIFCCFSFLVTCSHSFITHGLGLSFSSWSRSARSLLVDLSSAVLKIPVAIYPTHLV